MLIFRPMIVLNEVLSSFAFYFLHFYNMHVLFMKYSGKQSKLNRLLKKKIENRKSTANNWRITNLCANCSKRKCKTYKYINRTKYKKNPKSTWSSSSGRPLHVWKKREVSERMQAIQLKRHPQPPTSPLSEKNQLRPTKFQKIRFIYTFQKEQFRIYIHSNNINISTQFKTIFQKYNYTIQNYTQNSKKTKIKIRGQIPEMK